MPAHGGTLELLRLNLGEKSQVGEGVLEGRRAELAQRGFGRPEVALLDRAGKSSVCRALTCQCRKRGRREESTGGVTRATTPRPMSEEPGEQAQRIVNELLAVGVPPDAARQRVTLWPVVNWLAPLYIRGDGETQVISGRQQPDYIAMRSQLLPRVPVPGEECGLPGAVKAMVESVLWTEDGRNMVTLKEVIVPPDYLDLLAANGWVVSTREDPDEWLRALLDP